jgi:glycerol kinase
MILAIDQSTAGTKMLLFGPDGELVRRRDLPHRQMIDENSWVEHDPAEIWQNVLKLARGMADEGGFAPLGAGHQQPAGNRGGLGPPHGQAAV